MDGEKHLETLIHLKERRLRHQEKTAATMGPTVDPSISMEIEDLQEEIEGLRQQLRQAQATVVKLFTRRGARPTTSNYLDWSTYYDQTERLPGIWQTTWFPQIQRIQQKHREGAVVILSPAAHLSAGIAFGYSFPIPMKIPVWVEQTVFNRDDPDIWRSNSSWSETSPLHCVRDIVLESNTEHLLLELGITRPTQTIVDRWLSNNQTMWSRHMTIEPVNGPADTVIESGAQAVFMAHTIRQYVSKIYAVHPNMTTHIVGAFPIGLAVFLGMHFNACGNIQCYEYDRQQQTYTPTCLLTPQ
ncbi:MAG: SAVED domain-containing protein [Blastochloris sp.]|nr:SAVED domain-containing protein [Blastochloris sp.]